MMMTIQNQDPKLPPFKFDRPKLYKKQREAFYTTARYSIIEASTKAGKTHGAIVWLFEQAALGGGPGKNYWWVAPVMSQAKIAFRRMCRAIPKHMRTVNITDREITLCNGSIITFKSGEIADNLYGEDVYAAVIDEASRMREESWHAVRSTLTATRGPIRVVGNVKGRKNFFYALARKAQAGAPNMKYTKITAYDAVAGGVLDMEEIEDAKALLPEDIFKELYLAEPTDDGGNPFGVKNIQNCFRPNATKGTVNAFGADIAKSFDWAVLTGLDGGGVQAYFDRWQGPLAATTARIGAVIGQTKTAVDATGMGVMPAEVLQKSSDSIIPYVFTSKSKQTLMEALVVAIQRSEIVITDQTTYDELMEFEFEYTRTGVIYTAPAGFHDDCVIALALANYARGSAVATWGIV